MHRILHTAADASTLDIIDQYTVAEGMVSVMITGDGRYMVDEPAFSAAAGAAYSRIMSRMRDSLILDADAGAPGEADRAVYDAFWRTGLAVYPRRELEGLFHSLKYYLSRDLNGYGVLHPMMTDPDIEDILASAPRRPVHIRHKRHSARFHSLVSNVSFPSDGEMVRFINRAFARTGNEPTVAKPGGVTYLPDKSRVSATVGNIVSEPGSTIAIRRFPRDPYVITHMLRHNTLTPRMAAFLWSMLDAQGAGLVIGTTGSGKTTLLNAMATMMHPRWRVLTIEDSLELRIPHQDWVRYRTKRASGTAGSEHDVTISRLIDQSLTQRPDYEIVGEIRDVADARQLFQSMGTGHGGLCLPPGEPVPVLSGGAISCDAIQTAAERFRAGEPLHAYSVRGGACGWHRITGAVTKRGPDDWRLVAAGGAAVRVHAGHRMITGRGLVRAGELRIGDTVPVASKPYRAPGARPAPGGYAWETVDRIERRSLGTKLYDLEVRAAGNYAHGGGVITHNTTFHANTPRGALTRMELGGVSHAELALLSFIVYIAQVRTGGAVVRRVRGVTEVAPDASGRPRLTELFSHSTADDSFAESAGLLGTERYMEACLRGNVRDPEADMAAREGLLRECVARGADTVRDVFGILGRHYDGR